MREQDRSIGLEPASQQPASRPASQQSRRDHRLVRVAPWFSPLVIASLAGAVPIAAALEPAAGSELAIGSTIGSTVDASQPNLRPDLQLNLRPDSQSNLQSNLRPGSRSGPQPADPTPSPESPQFIRPPARCPEQLQTLVPLLLRDLPSYANRVTQRDYTRHRTAERPGYVLLAGRPEYEPLGLGPGEYSSTTESQVPQVFFTTLERQYLSGQAFQLQHYHWLFLTPGEQGWRLVMMLSSVGDHPANEPPTPPRDSSQGVLAQAIRLWLRDCEAGSIEVSPETNSP